MDAHEERVAKMQAERDKKRDERIEAEVKAREDKLELERATRQADEEILERIAGPVSDTDTRDKLLERIRKMRAEKPPEIKPMGRISAQQIQEFEAEQAAGRAAVAKAQAEIDRNRESVQKAKAEDAARQGTMTTVYHPNPSMDEQFPASKATLGKTK